MEEQRSFHLAQIGNFLHPSVPISNNEVSKELQSTGIHVVIITQYLCYMYYTIIHYIIIISLPPTFMEKFHQFECYRLYIYNFNNYNIILIIIVCTYIHAHTILCCVPVVFVKILSSCIDTLNCLPFARTITE